VHGRPGCPHIALTFLGPSDLGRLQTDIIEEIISAWVSRTPTHHSESSQSMLSGQDRHKTSRVRRQLVHGHPGLYII